MGIQEEEEVIMVVADREYRRISGRTSACDRGVPIVVYCCSGGDQQESEYEGDSPQVDLCR